MIRKGKIYEGNNSFIYQIIGQKLHKIHSDLKPPVSKNQQRHLLYRTEGINYYCIFQREKFREFNHNFQEFSNEFPQYAGESHSINLSILHCLAQEEKKTYLITARSPREIFISDVKKIHAFCTSHSLVRRQLISSVILLNGKVSLEHKAVCYIPFHEDFFKRFEDFLR